MWLARQVGVDFILKHTHTQSYGNSLALHIPQSFQNLALFSKQGRKNQWKDGILSPIFDRVSAALTKSFSLNTALLR